MKDSFIFYASFDEALRELPDKSRLKIYDATTDYALRGIQAEFSGVEKAVFTLIKQQIDNHNKRVENGKKGGRKKSKLEPNLNQGSTILEPNLNHSFEEDKTKVQPYLSSKEKGSPIEKIPLTEKERSKEKENTPEKDITPKKENIPPIIPPQGDGERDFKAKFFSVYCQFKKFAGKDYPEIDFEKLLDEFNRSSQLRKMFSWQVILDSYPAIIRGDFRDADKQNPFAGIDAKAARERWYAERKAKAENKANKVLERFLQNEEFKRIHKRLRTIELDIAKAECDPKGQKQLVELTNDKNRLTMQYRNIIELNGMEEEDLLPKWHCRKCSDTGYQEDGKMCDCYEVAL